MRVALRDGTRIFFEVIGTKLVADGPTMRERPTLLLLHGGPGFDHSGLASTLAPLSDVAQLVLLDHRGQGRSDGDDVEQWNLDHWVPDIADFCEALGLERPMILGQSFGGVVALAVAARYPDLPSKLIVSSSLAKFRPDRAFPMFEQLGGPEVREVAERHFRDLTDETAEEFLRVCLPVYNTTPADPDVIARGPPQARGRKPLLPQRGLQGRSASPSCRASAARRSSRRRARPDHARRRLAGHCRRDPTGGAARLRGAGHGVFRDKPEEAIAVIQEFVVR